MIMLARKVLVLFTLLVIIGIVIFISIQRHHATPAELLKAEHDIYSLLLLEQKNAYSDKTDQIQLVEFTNSGDLQGHMFGNSAGIQKSFSVSDLPKLQISTWMDYQEKNKNSYPIKDFLPSAADVIFVNPANGKQLYWWVSFSRIGFNSSLTQALVLVGDCRGAACYDKTSGSIYSMGDYVLLQKISGRWNIQSRENTWFFEGFPAPQ